MAKLDIYHLLPENDAHWNDQFYQKRLVEYVNQLIQVVAQLCKENKHLTEAVEALQRNMEKYEGRLSKKVGEDYVDRRMSSVNERLQQRGDEERIRDLDIDLLEKVLRMAERKGWGDE